MRPHAGMANTNRWPSGRGVRAPSPFARGWKRGSRSRSGQRFALPPSAADCPPRDREPLFTLAWLGATDRSTGAGRDEYSHHPPTAHSAWAGGAHSQLPIKAPSAWGRPCLDLPSRRGGERRLVLRRGSPRESRARRWAMAVSGERRLFPSSWREGEAVVFRKELSYGEAEQRAYLPTRQSPPKPGRAVFGSREHARGRGIDGPTEGSLRPKAVERSADRRRAVDSSPLPDAKKKEPPSPPTGGTLVHRDRLDPPIGQEPVERRYIFSEGHHLPLVVPQLTSEHFENLP